MDLADRIRARKLDLNLSQEEIAIRAGISQGMVAKLINRKAESTAKLPELAKALECSVEWLSYGTKTLNVKENSAHYNTEPASAGFGKAPLISNIQAGTWMEGIDEFAPNDAEQWIPKPAGGANSFYLRVVGESMTSPTRPSFPEGDLVLIDPDEQWTNGSFVVAKLVGHNGVTLKQLKYDEQGEPYLKPLNPDPYWKNIYDEFRILGKVVFSCNFY